MSQSISITANYLWIPIKCSAGGEAPLPEERLIFLRRNGQVVRYFAATPATWEDHAWIVSYSVQEFRGDTLEISEELPAFRLEDHPAPPPNDPAEPLRPRFHFTPRTGWINDPNGLYWRDGLWHLFYQINPFSLGMNIMHWGEAVSPDLLHWQDYGTVLYADGHGAAWSGSAVVDHQNTSGLAKDGQPAVCLFYTAAGRDVPGYDGDFTQRMAFGHGHIPLQFTRHPHTLVAHRQAENRDPRVVWYEEGKCWLMVMLLAYDNPDEAVMRGTVMLCRSTDLIHWDELQQIRTEGGACPDFFPLEYEDAPGTQAWVLMNIPASYLVGSFDGKHFTPEGAPRKYVECVTKAEFLKRFDASRPFNMAEAYPSQTFSHAPDNRRVGILKLAREFAGGCYNSLMSLPLEFSLRHNAKGESILLKRPAREIRSLIQPEPPAKDANNLYAKATFQSNADGAFTIRGCHIQWNAAKGEFAVAGCISHPEIHGDTLEVEVFVDTATMELFVNDGEIYYPGNFVADGRPIVESVTTQGTIQLELHAITPAPIQYPTKNA